MRLVTFIREGRDAVGTVLKGRSGDDQIVDLNRAHTERTGESLAPTMRTFLEQGKPARQAADETLRWIESALEQEQDLAGEVVFGPNEVKLTAPVPDPQKIVAIGLNYMDHCREQGVDPPERPIIFAKYPSAIIGPGVPITWPPDLAQQVDCEAELAVVIGRRARSVSPERAYDYVAGYMNLDDVSARDLQFDDGQWVRGKSLDTFCPIGPYLVTHDEIEDPHRLAIRCTVNDQVLQDSSTGEMIFKVPELVAFTSRAFTLMPGDIIATGTPHGVGVFRDPQVFLKPGDRVSIEVEGLGRLTNPVVTWSQA
ncbi:MAG: fumarylacetoacetate hydrolase family protein [Candidatus Bipolaricaulia bacterium]